jgi:hypothetical protein
MKRNLTFLEKAYLNYFHQVMVDSIGGKNRIHHITACRALVKKGLLKELKGTRFTLR